jgi:hypothetical protein
MAQWHFIKGGAGFAWDEGGEMVSNWDDGLALNPDEEGFSREAADAKAASLGKGVTAEYSGTPNWHARIDAEQAAQAEAREAATAIWLAEQMVANEKAQAEQRRAEVDAELDAMLNPDAVAVDAINARFDAMLEAAPDRKADIQKLRKAALKQLAG